MAYPTSGKYKDAVIKNSRKWKLKIDIRLDDGDTLHLEDEDITAGSLTFEEAATCSEIVDIGSTYANSLAFSLQNPENIYASKNFAYARVFAQVGLSIGVDADGKDVFEYIPLGEFFVQEDAKKLTTIPLRCIDRMALLNVPFSQLSRTVDETPKSIMEKVQKLRGGFSITNATQDMIDTLTNQLDFAVLPENMSCRDFIGHCAAIFGKNARFDREGDLEFFQCRIADVEENPEILKNIKIGEDTEASEDLEATKVILTTPETRLADLSFTDRLIRITRVKAEDAYCNIKELPEKPKPKDESEIPDGDETDISDNEEISKDLDEYIVSIPSNPLLVNSELHDDMLDTSYKTLTSIPYTGYQTGIIGDPSIQAGDPVWHIDVHKTDGVNIYSLITHHKYKYRGSGTIEAKGEPVESNRQLTNTNKQIIEAVRRTKEDFNDAVTSMEQAQIRQTELVANTMGFYIHEEIDPETGAYTKLWLMDKPTPEKSDTIWTVTADGWFVSKDHGVSWAYGMDDDGNIVANSVISELIQTGVLQSMDGLIKIDLGSGEMKSSTPTGYTKIRGHEILIHGCDETIDTNGTSENDKTVSFIKLSTDEDPNGNIADMSLRFCHKDGVLSGFTQQFEYDAEGKIVSAGPFTVSDLRVESKLEVTDSIVYDKIIMQRKSSEDGNTGVDFVNLGV